MTNLLSSTKRRHQLDSSVVYFKGQRLKTHKNNPIFLERKIVRFSKLQSQRIQKLSSAKYILYKRLIAISEMKTKLPFKKQIVLSNRLKKYSVWLAKVADQEKSFADFCLSDSFNIEFNDRRHKINDLASGLWEVSYCLEQNGVVNKGFTKSWSDIFSIHIGFS